VCGTQGFTVRKLHLYLYPLQQAAGGSARCDRRLRVRLIDLPPWKNTHTYTLLTRIHTHIQSCDRRPHTRRRRRLLWFSLGLCNVTTFDPIARERERESERDRGLLIRPGTPLPPPAADDFLPG